ncbi:MAG: hypothetical protein JSR18_09380 [Proteobacteria bacterium]|nr:hypothetical protein [Pseudomonadota bacterium]
MPRTSFAAAFAATAIALGAACAVHAQGMPRAAAAPGAAPTPAQLAEMPPASGSTPAGAAPLAGPDAPAHVVLRIVSVEVVRTTHPPYMDIVRVRGLASSAGWEEVELVPLTRGSPPDGILHLVLVARPPGGAADATGYEPVDAILPLSSPAAYKGVSVHAATNSVEVDTSPGYAEAKPVNDDCGTCVGKVVLAKGASAPAGAEVIAEGNLPPGARVVRPGDGLMGAGSDPNRLSLIVNKEGRIVSAVWD